MARRQSYTPGTPSWTDLTTPDQDAAQRFYVELFGWEGDDEPAGEGVVYLMMRLQGSSVAAISPQPQQQREAGAPPSWNTYITVESADAALRRAQQLGATVHAPAFDVLDAGRMGVVLDPQGGYFAVWEPRAIAGAELVNAPGAISWNELVTADVDGSIAFYQELFGWRAQPLEGLQMPYLTITATDGRTVGGIRGAAESEPAHWLVYFGCAEVEAALEQVQQLGGRKLMGPMSIGPGTIAAVSDPQGAVFALYSGRFED